MESLLLSATKTHNVFCTKYYVFRGKKIAWKHKNYIYMKGLYERIISSTKLPLNVFLTLSFAFLC
jgi:hypothetical protein